jgi:hypothetical protein
VSRNVSPRAGSVGDQPVVAFAVAAVAEAARRTELVQQHLVCLEGRQVEHAPVAAALARRSVDPLRREAVIAGHVWRYAHRLTVPTGLVSSPQSGAFAWEPHASLAL